MRKRVQESIINNKLATITIPVTHPETKKEHLIDKFFIQYESGIRKKAGAGIKKSGEQYEQKDIVLRINGEVLAFLDKMHLIKTGKAKGKIIGEYWENITFFSKEISRAIERLKEMEGYSGNPELQRLNLCINVHGPVMHELVEYVFYRWKRGRKALNTEYMEISYQDFINKAGAPEYKKEIQKREFLLIAVKMIVDWIREQNKAVTLPGSGAIKSESDSLKIWKETTGSREAFSAKK